MTLTTDMTTDGDRTSVLLEGELDMASATAVVEAVTEALDQGAQAIVLDLRDLTFMDSSGLRVFFDLRARAEQAGATLTASGARGMVRRALDATGVALDS